MFNKLKDKKGTREYDEWFLNYNPIEKDKMKALKGKNAKKFNEKIKDLNKFSPSYSKHKDRAKTKMRTMTRTIRTRARTPRTKTRTHKIHRV
jgi:1,6-anhydro-N-acetylmuramate kinase